MFWLSLHSGDSFSGENELTNIEYSRIPVSLSRGRTTRSITSNIALNDWLTITHIGLWSAETGGALLKSMPFPEPLYINMGDRFYLEAGALFYDSERRE